MLAPGMLARMYSPAAIGVTVATTGDEDTRPARCIWFPPEILPFLREAIDRVLARQKPKEEK